MRARIARLSAALGVDFHIATTLLLRGWLIAAGLIMLLVIPLTLTEQQQGYYFTFSSLLGLQIFFELGLNQVITQLVSKELSLLDAPSGGAVHLDRLRSVVTLLRRWYAVAAILFFLTCFSVGTLIFDSSGTLATSNWIGPWAVLTVVTAINLYFSPFLAVAEGCGKVGQVARLRLIQSILGLSLTWVGLLVGLGLWAIPLSALTANLSTSMWLLRGRHGLERFNSASPIPSDRAIDWRNEVFPFQWRVAVSWISGYLIYQLFTPFVFVHLGPIAAGQLGMSIAIFLAIQSVGVSWISARLPNMSGLIAQGDRLALNRLFRITLSGAFSLTVAGCVGVVILIAILNYAEVGLAGRLADIPTITTIAFTTMGNMLVFGLAAYMRAHGEEPMLPPSISSGVITLIGAYIGSFYGTFPTMLVSTIVTFIVAIPWTAYLFREYWNRV